VKQVKATQTEQGNEKEKKAAVIALIKSLVAITLDISAELCNCFDDKEDAPEVPPLTLTLLITLTVTVIPLTIIPNPKPNSTTPPPLSLNPMN
jgi:hypothetical protein